MGLSLGLGIASCGASAQAEEVVKPAPEVTPLIWNEAWPEFRTGEWITFGSALAVFAASKLGPHPSGHWRGNLPLDRGARDALRIDSAGGREVASALSHVGLLTSMAWPFFDAGVVAGWQGQSPRLGWQQALISAEALAITSAMQGVVSTLVRRERPYGRDCGGEEDADSLECSTSYRYWSFYSAHSSLSFAGASTLCMHHAYVPLYGGGAGDVMACAGALTLAGSTALLRIATDAHHLSDVLVGAVMGTATGLLVPWGLHYRYGAEQVKKDARESGAGQFMLLPEGLGARAVWVF